MSRRLPSTCCITDTGKFLAKREFQVYLGPSSTHRMVNVGLSLKCINYNAFLKVIPGQGSFEKLIVAHWTVNTLTFYFIFNLSVPRRHSVDGRMIHEGVAVDRMKVGKRNRRTERNPCFISEAARQIRFDFV
jgi:hypothetical protein